MMEENERDVLVSDIVFGKRIETFFSSDIGQYLLRRIVNEAQEYTDKLIVADPTDYKEIQRLQNGIYVASSIKRWLEESLVQALESEVRLNETDQ
jgi:hypothetical protein